MQGFPGHLAPIRLGEKPGKNIRNVKYAGQQEDFFYHFVSPFNDQPPDKKRAQRHQEVFTDPKQLGAGGDTGKLGDGIKNIGER